MKRDSDTGEVQHGVFARAVLTLNGIDPSTARSSSEVVLPTILMAFVVANACVATFFFALASKVFFNDLVRDQQVIAGLVIGLIVGMVDWLIISWHPSLPGWYISGSRVLPVRLLAAKSIALAAAMGALVWLATMSIDPPLHWYQQVPLAASTALIVGVAAAVVLQWRFGGTTLPDGIYPRMPAGVEKIPSFLIRLLLTVTLAFVVGFGISVVSNADAVEQGRLLVAQDAAVQRKQRAENERYDTAKEEYPTLVEAVRSQNSARAAEIKRLTDLRDDQEETAAEKLVALNEAIERREREREIPGLAGLEAAKRAQESAQDAKDAADAKLAETEDLLAAATLKEILDEPPVPERATFDVTDLDPVDVDLDAVQGIAGTWSSLHKAAEDQGWPWWALWGPEIVVLIIDMIPVLLKLTSGYQPAEQRGWRRSCQELEAEILDELESQADRRAAIELASTQSAAEQGVAEAQRAARVDAAEVEGRGMHDVAEVRRAAQVSVAEIESEGLVEVARLQAAMRLKAAQTDAPRATDSATSSFAEEGTSCASQIIREILDNPTADGAIHSENPSSFEDDLAWMETPTRTPRDEWFGDPQLPEDQVVTAGGQRYFLGPQLSSSSQGESMNDVHVAVQIPGQGAKLSLVDTTDVTSRCVVVKTRGPEVDSRTWEMILNTYQSPIAHVTNPLARCTISDDDRLVNANYYPRTDLDHYLGMLQAAGIKVRYSQAASWGLNLCSNLRELHRVKRSHNDVKPGNILVTGLMTLRGSSLDGDPIGDLILGDIDLASEVGERSPNTPEWAAPETLDHDSPHWGRSSLEADVFSAGAVLLYILTGLHVNQMIALQGQPNHPPIDYRAEPLHGWMEHYSTVFSSCMRSLTEGIPRGLADTLVRMLAPNPSDRPLVDEAEQLLGEARFSGGAGTFSIHIGRAIEPPVGLGPELIQTFETLGYNLNGVRS